MKQRPAISTHPLAYLHLARLHKPMAIFLLFCPCLWGVAIGLQSADVFGTHKFVKYVFILFLGAIASRSFGCIVNDILDANIDAKTNRTSSRPIAAKLITKKQAIKFALFFAVCGAILLFFLPLKAMLICCLSAPLIYIYPLAKRFTNLPQVVLGCVFNLGIFVGYFCFASKITLNVVILYLVAILWTIIYDTLYAMQDLADDIANKTKSITIFFGATEGKILVNLIFLCFLIEFLFILTSSNLTQFAIFTSAFMFLLIVCIATMRQKIFYFTGFNLCNIFGVITLLGFLG